MKLSFRIRAFTSPLGPGERPALKREHSAYFLVDLSDLGTANVTEMSQMFEQCSSIETLDLSSFDTSKVTTMRYMFYGCSSLKTVYVSEMWTTSALWRGDAGSAAAALTGDNMFVSCNKIIGGNNTAFDVNHLDDSYARIDSTETPGYFTYRTYKKHVNLGAVAPIPDQNYSAQNVPSPPITLTVGGKTLKEGIDYSVTYEEQAIGNCVKVTATGKGDYSGTIYSSFGLYDVASDSVFTFADVNAETAHADDISWMRANKISLGWVEDDGSRTFRPLEGIARTDMAAFLFRLGQRMGVVSENWQPEGEQSKAFSDVDNSISHHREIWWLASVGISSGWDNGNGTKSFRPYDKVTRQDMAAFIQRLAKKSGKGRDATETSAKLFSDVSATDADNHHDEIWWLASNGITEGWPAGDTREFRGLQNVARCDMAAFLHRLDSLV